MVEEPIIAINVSKKQTLVFYERHFIYRGEHINYTEVDGMAYLLTRTRNSINFIPTHATSSFEIKLEAKGQVHKIDASASSFMWFKGEGEKEKQELFAKLIYVLDVLIKPFVLINLLLKFSREKELKIDTLSISSVGFSQKRLWRSPTVVPWSDFYNAVLEAGALRLYKNDQKKKYREFFACSLSAMNAPVIPDFCSFLFPINGHLDEKTVNELIAKKHQDIKVSNPEKKEVRGDGEFCWSCGAPVELEQNFCTLCGSKLK